MCCSLKKGEVSWQRGGEEEKDGQGSSTANIIDGNTKMKEKGSAKKVDPLKNDGGVRW